jgi:photosystem II stability/assembly factor-like uncharacterized protein
MKVKTRLPFICFSMTLILGVCVATPFHRYSGSKNQDRKPVDEGENLTARLDDFQYQHSYGLGYIPPDARLQAWKDGLRNCHESADRWRPIGPRGILGSKGDATGRINAIAVSPKDPNLILVGSATGGIWRSRNGGRNFRPVSDNVVSLSVGSIAFYRKRPAIVYAGMGDPVFGYLGHGVIKSTNGGRGWRRVSDDSLPSPCTISKIEVDPDHPNRVYVAQHSRMGVEDTSGFYISTDGGARWKATLRGEVCDAALDMKARKTIYACIESGATNQGSPPGVYRSTDRGESWQPVLSFTTTAAQGSQASSPVNFDATTNIYARIAISARTPQVLNVFAIGSVAGKSTNRLLATTDAGKTWSGLTADSIDTVQPWWDLYLAVDPARDNTLYIGTLDIHKTTDGGATFTNLTKNFNVSSNLASPAPTFAESLLHVDQHAIAFSPDSRTVYFANDGGIFSSTDGGSSFNSLNQSLSLTQFYSLAMNPSTGRLLFGGTQDNGTLRRENQSESDSPWNRVLASDGGACVICPTNPKRVFATQASGPLFVLNEYGAGQNQAPVQVLNISEPKGFTYPVVVAGKNGNLYIGTYRLWVSTVGCASVEPNNPAQWTTPGGDQDLTKGRGKQDKLTAIAVSASDTNYIYTGSKEGRTMQSSDGGKSWRDISKGLPNRYVSSIFIDPSSPSTALLTVSGFKSGHVFKTTDTGTTWSNISGNLPDISANTIIAKGKSVDQLYVGTDIGVFRARDGGVRWERLSKGIPPVIVRVLAFTPRGTLLAATFGRGVYELIERPASYPQMR